MLLKKLILTAASVAMLTAINLPAMAGAPVVFDFTSVLNPAIGSGSLTDAQRTLVGTLSTNNNGAITGGVPTWILGGIPITNILNVGGSYAPANYQIMPPAPPGPFTITSFNMQFTPPLASGINPQISLTFLKYSHGNPLIYAEDGVQNGGTSRADFRVGCLSCLPEIDGGVLPKGVFIVIGTFLLLYGRIERT